MFFFQEINSQVSPTLDPIVLMGRKNAPLKKAKWHLGEIFSIYLSYNINVILND